MIRDGVDSSFFLGLNIVGIKYKQKGNIMKKMILALGVMGFTASVQALDIDPDNFYYGAGFGTATFDTVPLPEFCTTCTAEPDDTSPFQVFVGIPLEADLGAVKSSLEVGFRNMGSSDLKYCDSTGCFTGAEINAFLGPGTVAESADLGSGLFIDYVAAYPVAEQFDVMGIIGLDLNSDMDMLEYGLGAQLQATDQLGIRATYLFKETDEESVETNILMFGVTYRK